MLCSRISAQGKKRQDYRTLNFQINSARSEHLHQSIQSNAASESTGNDTRILGAGEMPTYSVFVGGSNFNDVNSIDHLNGSDNNPCARM